MTSTADRWFVSDRQYHLSTNDYALVRRSTASVHEDLLETDMIRTRVIDTEATFRDEYDQIKFEPCYEFALHGRLVYADVDDEDPAHKEKVFDQGVKETPIEEDSEKTADTKKELIKVCGEAWYSKDDDSENDEESMSQEERERWTQRDLKMLIRQGLIEPPICSLLLTAKTVEDKEEILSIVSGQSKRPIKRPVLVLVDMIDSKQNAEVGQTEGWVIAYDFVKELLVIKPFISKKGKHPLGEKWYGDVAQDGVSFCGTLKEFAKTYAEFGNTVDPANKDDGFRMLVQTVAARWIDFFGKDLVAAYGTEFQPDLLAVKEANEKILKAMENIKFPTVQKNEKPGYEIEPLLWLQSVIETEEAGIRDAAVDAKEKEEEKVAQDAAKLYESVLKQIKDFNDSIAEMPTHGGNQSDL